MSSDTLVKLGGTQNKAWAESMDSRLGIRDSRQQVLRNENDENDGMERGRRTRKGRRRAADTHSNETASRESGYAIGWCRFSRLGLGNVESDQTNLTFISTIGSFNDVLSNLNKEHSDVLEKMKEKEKKDEKKKSKKEKSDKKKKHAKSKDSHSRHKYKKILRNKTVSTYSSEDLNAILGVSPRDDDSVV